MLLAFTPKSPPQTLGRAGGCCPRPRAPLCQRARWWPGHWGPHGGDPLDPSLAGAERCRPRPRCTPGSAPVCHQHPIFLRAGALPPSLVPPRRRARRSTAKRSHLHPPHQTQDDGIGAHGEEILGLLQFESWDGGFCEARCTRDSLGG